MKSPENWIACPTITDLKQLRRLLVHFLLPLHYYQHTAPSAELEGQSIGRNGYAFICMVDVSTKSREEDAHSFYCRVL